MRNNQRSISRCKNNQNLFWMISSLVCQIVVVVVVTVTVAISNIRPVYSLQERIQTFGRHHHQYYNNHNCMKTSTSRSTSKINTKSTTATRRTTGLSLSEKNKSVNNNNPIVMDDESDPIDNNNSNDSVIDSTTPPSQQQQRIIGHNKSMEFLRKMGKVGGAANRDFRFAVGVDEGPSGKSYSNTNSNMKVRKIKKVIVII